MSKNIAYSQIQHGKIIPVSSLNNRKLLINTKNIRNLILNDDNADPYFLNEELEWHSDDIYPLEIYDVLEKIYYEEEYEEEYEYDNSIIEYAKKIIKENALKSEEIFEFTNHIRIIDKYGHIDSFCCDNYENFEYIYFYYAGYPDDDEDRPKALLIDGDYIDVCIPLDNIAIIEAPILKINKVIIDEMNENI